MITGEDVVSVAREWKGAPFLHQGRGKKGVDCAGLIIGIAVDLGITAEIGYVDTRDYPREPTTKNMMLLLRRYLDVVRGPMQAGDVLHFAFKRLPQHVAIYTGGDNRIVHAFNSGRQMVIETGFTGKWPERVRTVYRYPGVVT